MKEYIACFFICVISATESQACDSRSESSQCSEGQICRNYQCVEATRCMYNCSTTGTECVADYCQPESCTATGQCVHGQICSQNLRQCVYLVRVPVEVESEVKLHPIRHVTDTRYDEVIWIKGPGNQPIASFGRGTNGQTVYFDEYCTTMSTPATLETLAYKVSWESGRTIVIEEFGSVDGKDCLSSDRVELNTRTGALTLHNVQLTDEDYYYCKVNAGTKYAIHLETYVVPKEEDIVMHGVPTSMISKEREVQITCTVPRIKPQPVALYLRFNGQRYDSVFNSALNTDTGTFETSANFTLTMSPEDNGWDVICVVIPEYGRKGSINKTVTVGVAKHVTIEGLPDIVAEDSTHTVSCVAIGKRLVIIELRLANTTIPGGLVSRITAIYGQTRKDHVISFRKEDNGKMLQCTAETLDGPSFTVNKTVNVGYSPTGTPRIKPTRRERLVKERITLICDTTAINQGHPMCQTFEWRKTGSKAGPFNRRQTYQNKLEFEMDASLEGNYTCLCRNDFGDSLMSAPVELVLCARNFRPAVYIQIYYPRILSPDIIIICLLVLSIVALTSFNHSLCKKRIRKLRRGSNSNTDV